MNTRCPSFSYVDMINVMTYDLYGGWTPKLGHHSALFYRPGEKGMERELNTVCVFFLINSKKKKHWPFFF